MKTVNNKTALFGLTSKETPVSSVPTERRTAFGGNIRNVLLLLSCAALASCGGGDSGGSGGGSAGSAGIAAPVEDFGIAYVKQPVPEMDTQDVREPSTFNEGSDLYFRDLASPGANERNITSAITGGLGDVKDVEVSYDGSKLLFALRLPEIEGADPEDQPTWNIWEYEIATRNLRRVIESDIFAEQGQDVAPHYLADGRIIFSSTRQRTAKAILLDDGKPQFSALDENGNEPASVLHVMDADGTDIHQVTFNQSHDLDPVLLTTGEVVFSRWDNAGGADGIHLYKMYPDGTNQRLLYGANSHDTGTNGATVQFLQPREMPDGKVMALIKPFTGNFQGADVVEIDVDNYVDNQQALTPNQGILLGPAQETLAFGEVRTDLEPSPGGRYNSFFPLWDGTNRALISWTQCRLMDNDFIVPCTDQTLNDPNMVEAPPLYSLFIYDMDSQTQIPVFTPREGTIYRDAVVAQPRALPTIVFDGMGVPTEDFDFDPSLVADDAGVINILSVYDFDGIYDPLALGPTTAPDLQTMADPMLTLADERPARFLRVVKAVSIPDDDVKDLDPSAFGVGGRFMREVVAYAPIEPDGSVRVKVPANVPLSISVLNAEGKRISNRHDNWLTLIPGEIMTCAGCHDPASGTSHGRAGTSTPLNTGAPFEPYVFPNTENFVATTGETMAEARTRMDVNALEPSVDIHYQDVWSDAATIAAGRQGNPIDYQYADLDASLTAPVSAACQTNWDAGCRIIINYEQHIHPLWTLDRAPSPSCISCHTNKDAMDNDMVPDGQLDLTDGASDLDPDHFKSYRELVSGDFEQILDANGQLVDREEPATTPPLFLTDANGDPLLDADGNPIPRLVRFPVPRSMVVGSALASGRFFNRFSDPNDADHFGLLSPAELKLIAEWLDIGGKYYNNPFDAP